MNALIAQTPRSAGRANKTCVNTAGGIQSRPVNANGPRAKILCAEDDAWLRRAVELILSREGHSVTAVADGLEALSALRADRYDLLITDNNMPRLSGLELIHKLSTTHVEIPIIMVSGSIFDLVDEDLRQIERRGSVLAKPFAPEQLIALVNDVLRAAGKTGASGGLGLMTPSKCDTEFRPHSRLCINE